jgi:hypothetical protein
MTLSERREVMGLTRILVIQKGVPSEVQGYDYEGSCRAFRISGYAGACVERCCANPGGGYLAALLPLRRVHGGIVELLVRLNHDLKVRIAGLL